MAQYKSILPTQAEIIKEWHGKIKRRELAEKVGISENKLKTYLKKNKMRSQPGPPEVPFLEQKINIYVSGIKRKYYKEATAAAREAVERFKN